MSCSAFSVSTVAVNHCPAVDHYYFGFVCLISFLAAVLRIEEDGHEPEDRSTWMSSFCSPGDHCIISALVSTATDLWQNFGKTSEEATKAYIPLLQGSVNNIAKMGFPGCLTGPIARGAVKTIQRHLAALEKSAPDILPLYKELGLKTIPIGIAKGTLSESNAEELRVLLEGP